MTEPKKSAFDAVGAANSYINAKNMSNPALSIPFDMGTAINSNQRAGLINSLNAPKKPVVTEAQLQPAAQNSGFWSKIFAGMEKAYNFSSQVVSFGLTLAEDNNPLYQGGFSFDNIKNSWDAARQVSPGRAFVRTFVGTPIDDIEGLFSGVVKTVSGGKLSGADKFLQDHMLFAANDFNIYNEAQREKAFREQTAGRWSSWTTDVVARFVIDPTIFAGKAVKAYKAGAVAIKGSKELKGIMAGEITGRKAERIKATFTDFLEKTDGMDASDLFRVKAIRESANPASFADILADANKIEDKLLRHQAKADIIHWAMGDASAANRLVQQNEAIAAKIGQLQDEVVNAKYFGSSYNPKTKEYTLDLTNNGADYENVETLVNGLETQADEIYKKLSAEAIISPNLTPKFGALDALRTGSGPKILESFNARSQEFIDIRAGAAGTSMRFATGFFYKRPKGWIDFTDNQSVQTIDNMLSRVRGVSDKQQQIYVSKIAAKEAELKAAVDNGAKKNLSKEIKTLKKDLEQATFTLQRRDELFQKYIQATDPASRANAYMEIEEELFTTVARQFGYGRDDVRKAWQAFAIGRAKAHNIIRERAYTGAIDPATGAPVGAKIRPIVDSDGAPMVIPMPLNETQLVKQLPTLDIDAMYNVLNRYTRASRLEKNGKIYNLYTGGISKADSLVNGIDSLLKIEVLGRLGYPIRNVVEGSGRILFTAGPMALIGRYASGKNILANKFKDASIEDIFNWQDDVKLAAKKTELEMSLHKADDPVQIQREIDEIDKMLNGTIKKKDKYGLGLFKIQVGNEVITVEDALGATPERARYIKEKFITNSAQIMDNTFSETSKRLKNIYETNGDFVVINGSDINWEDAYYRVVNRQIRNSQLTKILLQNKPREQLVNEAEDFLVSTTEGRKIMKNLAMGRDARSLAEANMLNVENLFADAPGLKAIANERAITLKDIKKYFGADSTRRPSVNAAQVGMANNTGSWMAMFRNIQDNFYNLAGEVPESQLVRLPLFTELYRKRVAASVQNAIETYPGNSIPPAYLRKLENSARQWARAEVRRTLYDTSERVAVASTLKYVFPFFGAFADVAEKWGKVVLNDPSVIRKLETTYDSPDRMGLTEERDGRTYINFPGEWAKRLSFGLVERPIAMPKASLNLIFQGGAWWNPGAGWFVQYPASVLVKKVPSLEQNALVKEVLPYGADGTGWKDFLVQSAGARKIMAIFDPEDPMRMNLTVLIAAEENAKYDQGARDTAPSAKEINDKVKNILALEAAARLVLPFATNTRSPYQLYIDQYHKLREQDPTTAAEKFYEMYGEDFYAFTTSLSKNNTGIAATIEADKRSKELADLIAKNPEYGWFVVGDANAGTFSPTVYQKQREMAVAPGSTMKFRESQDPYQAIKETNAEKGWIEYNKGMDLIEAERINRGLKSLNSRGAEDLKAAKEQFIANLSEENPDWASVRGKIDTQKVYNFLKFAEKTIQDPRIANRSDMLAIAEYLEGRQLIIAELAKRKSQNIDNEGNKDLREMWDAFTGDLIDRNVGSFSRVFTRYLEKDDLRKGL